MKAKLEEKNEATATTQVAQEPPQFNEIAENLQPSEVVSNEIKERESEADKKNINATVVL